jgi:translation elongation factor EF-1beta
MKVGLVVDTPRMATELNKILPKGSKAFAIGQAKVGWGFDKILVMATMTDERFSEWFDYFALSLAPGGEIVYD